MKSSWKIGGKKNGVPSKKCWQIHVKNRPQKNRCRKKCTKYFFNLVKYPKNATLSAKTGVRMIAYHNKKFIIEIWGRFWKPQIPIAYRTKSTVMPWPKAPLPYSCAHEQGRGHRRFCAISPVPDAFVKFSQWRRRRGRCCGASVGTTGSAPSARSRPRSVVRGLCWNHWFRPLWSITTPLQNPNFASRNCK